jgi:ribosomal protein S18 acetylase RimI-like enzyme
LSKPVATQPSLAWISMVLVLPEHRGKGYATQLLRESLEWLAEPDQRHLTPLLDATPAGHPVYLKLGFRDQWGFTRWERRPHLGKHPAPATESIVAIADWGINDPDRASVLALDQMAFGADRQQLLDDLVRRAPQLALALRSHDTTRGFLMARPGRQATQLGPLVAHDAETAIALADCALSQIEGPVFLDVPDARRDMEPWLDRYGFTRQRSFTRMALIHPGTAIPRSNPPAIFAVAGPELG